MYVEVHAYFTRTKNYNFFINYTGFLRISADNKTGKVFKFILENIVAIIEEGGINIGQARGNYPSQNPGSEATKRQVSL